MSARYYIRPGQRGRAPMPHSEVCMHMRVAGTPMTFTLLKSEDGYFSAQLFREDSSLFSFPISPGEAGLYREETEEGPRFYFYSEPELMEGLA